MPPSLKGCPIYVHDAHAVGNNHLPARYTPKNWQHDQYAVELWLQKAIASHPWRVKSPSEAQLIFVAANFSLWCAAGKRFSRRRLWKSIRQDSLLWPKTSGHTAGNLSAVPPPAVLLTSQYRFCGPPWDPQALQGANRPPRVLLLQDVLMGAEPPALTVISPFVVSKPAWLVGAAPRRTSKHVAWAERKLIFTAGHVPKIYISSTRYSIWRQLRTVPRTTAISPTLNCTVGAFAECRRGRSVGGKQF